MIKAVIFDCFGVILTDGLTIAYEKMGGDYEQDKDFLRKTIDAVNKGLLPSSIPFIAKKLGISDELWWQTIQSTNTTDYELLDFILVLRNKYKTALLSNISSGGLKRWFEPGFLDKYFDISIASGDIGYAKPEAQAYELVADKLRVRLNECVFIDDRQEYIDGAIAVGMQTILFTSSNQLKEDLSIFLQTDR